MGNATDSEIQFIIGKGDIESLERVLKKNGVKEDDLGELKEILKVELGLSGTAFGPRISGWISKMIKKAAEGVWEIGIGAAGNLLAQVIQKYYGANY